MIVIAVPNADPPYAFVEGIQSGRGLSTLTRAVMNWYAFGRYDYVMVDLNSFDDWSVQVADELATAASTAADAGGWLAFFPVAGHWLRDAGDGRLHSFPDRAHAQRAMQHHWSGRQAARAARSSVARGFSPLRWAWRSAPIAPVYETTASVTF